jgi:N-acetyl-gamma-glutamyl-phosphate reductase
MAEAPRQTERGGVSKARVAILGATGYGGGELLRLLLRHPHCEVVLATSRSEAGQPVAGVHRNLAGWTELAFSAAPDADALAEHADVVFGALPHGASAGVLAPLVDRGVRVIDLSGDFRLRDAASYRHWYRRDHPRPDLLGAAVYGCPEQNRAAIAASRFVAAPGCFATAINLALLPAARAGLLADGATPHVVAMTGSSGSGAEAQPGTHHPTRAQTLRAYKVLAHQHVPEILQLANDASPNESSLGALLFTPVSAPLVRGILAIATIPLRRSALPAAEAAYERAFADEPFVRTVADREPECAAVATTNVCEVRARSVPPASASGAGDGPFLHVTTALDNLVKGGAGQGVQCLNIMMGWDETAGLDWPGTWP